MKRLGFTLYRAKNLTDPIEAEGSYYLTWVKEKRGGMYAAGRTGHMDSQVSMTQRKGDTVSTTLTYHASDSYTHMSDGMQEAKSALNYLEEVVIRARLATWYLEHMTRRCRSPRIVNLSDLVPPMTCQGGMWRRSDDLSKSMLAQLNGRQDSKCRGSRSTQAFRQARMNCPV